MDFNKIVTQYKIYNHEPQKDLVFLMERLAQVDVDIVPLRKDFRPGENPLEGIWVDAELVSPQLSHEWFLPYELPEIGEEEAARMTSELSLPFARLYLNGENPNHLHPRTFYNRHSIGEFFKPRQGTRILETENGKGAAVITERKGWILYTELQLTY